MTKRTSILRRARGLELKVAKRVGGYRVKSGNRHGVDVYGHGAAFQVKSLSRFPQWMLTELMAMPDNLKLSPRRYLVIGGLDQADCLVVQTLTQFVEWHVGKTPDAPTF